MGILRTTIIQTSIQPPIARHGTRSAERQPPRRRRVPGDSGGRLPTMSEVGLFGPGSLTWRVNREGVLLLGGGAALVLQVAHPLVAAGVEEHSNYREDPWPSLPHARPHHQDRVRQHARGGGGRGTYLARPRPR